MCETVLLDMRRPGIAALILRPATVCGYASRLRLDLSVNILTHHAIRKRKITVFGGEQKRPNIHMADVCASFTSSRWSGQPRKSTGKFTTPAGIILQSTRSRKPSSRIVGSDVMIERTQTNDKRSYHISSEKIRRELGFAPPHSVEDAVRDLATAFKQGKSPIRTTTDITTSKRCRS